MSTKLRFLAFLALAALLELPAIGGEGALGGPLQSPAIRTVLQTTTPLTQASTPSLGTTLDPANKHAGITLSGGDLTAAVSSGSGVAGRNVRSTVGYSGSAKKCFKTTINSGSTGVVGLGLGFVNNTFAIADGATYVGQDANGIARYGAGNAYYNGGAGGFPTAGFADNDIIIACHDIANNKSWWKVNSGDWNGSATGDPVGNVDGEASTLGGTVYAVVELEDTAASVTVDFNPAGLPSGYTGF